ncbi:hypothetical protein [Deinococcus aestuarii]|uniref:hypothetical protein n=1 Tax=Deinococcus aestuarii TaxID=2774531 RepID=UPI001C0E07E6|nr:hypothetical protein [Deinococcus aestuarii]
MSEVYVGLKHSRGAWRAAVAPTGEVFSEDDSLEGVERLAQRIGELRPAAVLVQALGGGELPVMVALLERGVRVRVTSKEQVRAFAATAGAGLSGATTVVQMAGSVRFVTQEGSDERVRLLLARRRQVLEMRAQEEERLRGAEYAPLQEDLERHLFFLDRQLGRLHELLLYMVQAVLPREGAEAQGEG